MGACVDVEAVTVGPSTWFETQNPDSGLVMVDGAFWDDLFQTRSVMGRLWDDHFRDLGHPPKFYRVQDAGFIDGSSS